MQRSSIGCGCCAGTEEDVALGGVLHGGLPATSPSSPCPPSPPVPPQICNHPVLSYKDHMLWGVGDADIVAQSGKMLVLDRLLIKFHATGHRVLLFSTMTHLLDLLEVRASIHSDRARPSMGSMRQGKGKGGSPPSLCPMASSRQRPQLASSGAEHVQARCGAAMHACSAWLESIKRLPTPPTDACMQVYLRWRKLPDGRPMQYRRIDGSTPLESREDAIRDFNAPGSEVFLFLLSIRAAGRGLNLQTSDTVIIYDPDANPKNEEQAIARSHRIGQTKEVRAGRRTRACMVCGFACSRSFTCTSFYLKCRVWLLTLHLSARQPTPAGDLVISTRQPGAARPRMPGCIYARVAGWLHAGARDPPGGGAGRDGLRAAPRSHHKAGAVRAALPRQRRVAHPQPAAEAQERHGQRGHRRGALRPAHQHGRAQGQPGGAAAGACVRGEGEGEGKGGGLTSVAAATAAGWGRGQLACPFVCLPA